MPTVRLRDWWPTAAVALVVLAASVVDPGTVEVWLEHLPSLGGPSGGAGELPVPADKLGHLVLYAALAAAATGAARRTVGLRHPLLVAVLGAVAFGAGIEVLQSQLPYRSMEALDAAANGVGATVGAVAVGAVHRTVAGDVGP